MIYSLGRALERIGLRLQWFALDPSWRVGPWVVFRLHGWSFYVRPQTESLFAVAQFGPVAVTFQHPDFWDYQYGGA